MSAEATAAALLSPHMPAFPKGAVFSSKVCILLEGGYSRPFAVYDRLDRVRSTGPVRSLMFSPLVLIYSFSVVG